jgi:hypothetical protein
MTRDLSEVEDRLRATYRAVAATTVLAEDQPSPPQTAPAPTDGRRMPRLVTAMAMLALLVAGVLATLVVRAPREVGSGTTEVATQPTPATGPTEPDRPTAAASDAMCGSELPRPVDVPEGYSGPVRVASSVPDQLVVRWTSATGRIEARWPADAQFRDLGGPSAPTSDGRPSVAGSGVVDEVKRTADGSYQRTVVFFLRNVPSECRAVQVDVVDVEAGRADAAMARLSNKGLFVSDVPLVGSSEDRAFAPTVVPCDAPAGAVVPPTRGGPVSGDGIYAAPTDALQAFLDTSPSPLPNRYVEVRLPDGSIAYAREQPMNPGSYVTVVHVARTGGGWAVDRWESSGC